MKSFVVFILASLIPSASFLISDAAPVDTDVFLDLIFPSLPGLITDLTKLLEDASNGLPIDESSLNAISAKLKDTTTRLDHLYSNDLIAFNTSVDMYLLIKQLADIRVKAATLSTNPFDVLQNQGVDVNTIFDDFIERVTKLPLNF